MDRTPILEKLEKIKSSLDTWVNRIYQEVPFTSLDKDAILRIQKYMGINFSQKSTSYPTGYQPIDALFRPETGVVFYDIGYRLIKDQLEREHILPPDEKRMFYDGVMGWLFDNPGTKHEEKMNEVLLQYIERFGIDRLNRNFEQFAQRYAALQDLAAEVNDELERTHTDKRELTYWTLFVQSNQKPGFRIEKIAKIVPDFAPNLDKSPYHSFLEEARTS